MVDGADHKDAGQGAKSPIERLQETWEKKRQLPEKDFLAFQQWLWSQPLDVVIALWADAPVNLRPEFEPESLESAIDIVFQLLEKGAKFIISKLFMKTSAGSKAEGTNRL